MKKIVFLVLVAVSVHAQTNFYYPPILGTQWDTITPMDAGWCNDDLTELYSFLDSTNTRAFIVLYKGKRVVERYFHGFKSDSSWYWASAGKSLTAFLVGLAQQQGRLNINDPARQYLGANWTSCSASEELSILVKHQLAMSTGLFVSLQNQE